MSKYKQLRFLKRTKARVEHQCNLCGQAISVSEFYYAEKIKDNFLHFLHRKKYCNACYQRYEDKLLKGK